VWVGVGPLMCVGRGEGRHRRDGCPCLCLLPSYPDCPKSPFPVPGPTPDPVTPPQSLLFRSSVTGALGALALPPAYAPPSPFLAHPPHPSSLTPLPAHLHLWVHFLPCVSQVANNQSKALQMLLKAEELEAALVRESKATTDHLQVFQEVLSGSDMVQTCTPSHSRYPMPGPSKLIAVVCV
jgi:hypothetical protein